MTRATEGRADHWVRPAVARDLRHLAGIEEAADELVRDLGGPDLSAPFAGPARAGADRVAAPGFLLVAGEPVVGFVHVLDLDGVAHLDQLSVLPAAGRRGVGSALVRAALDEAASLGHRTVSLCTYRDVPWNAPWYARLGFVEVDALAPYQRALRADERRLGLDRLGPRVVMQAPTTLLDR